MKVSVCNEPSTAFHDVSFKMSSKDCSAEMLKCCQLLAKTNFKKINFYKSRDQTAAKVANAICQSTDWPIFIYRWIKPLKHC